MPLYARGRNLQAGTTVPATPAAPTVEAGDTEATMSWVAPANGGSPLTGYKTRYRTTAGPGTWTESALLAASTSSRTYTGLANGTSYDFAVQAFNSVGASNWSAETAATPTTPPPPAPDAPNLSTDGAITVGYSTDLASLVNSSNTGQAFYFPNGTYTNVSGVLPKTGMRFIGQSTTGVIIEGTSSRLRAFRGRGGGAGDGVVIANMTVRGYTGLYNGSLNRQNVAAIEGKDSDWDEGTTAKAADWHLYNVDILNNGHAGVWLGDRWIIQGGRISGHSPQGVGGGFGVGGWIYGVAFDNNGSTGEPGAGVNNANVKLAFWNVGPWGTTAHDTSRFVFLSNGAPYTSRMHNYATPSKFRLEGCTVNGLVGTNRVRGIWFDLDCRDMDVLDNTFTDCGVGAFYEGCNGGIVKGNTFTRCGAASYVTTGTLTSQYSPHFSVRVDVSSNTIVEDNTFHDCSGGIAVFYLGERGRNGADWVTTGTHYARADANFQIRNNFDAIAAGQASNVGSNNHTFRNNTITGSSARVGFLYNANMNRATEAHIGTHSASGNTYASTQSGSTLFFEDGAALTFAQWQAEGYDT